MILISVADFSISSLDSADVLLTVPAAWDAAGCALMREAAIRAGLVQSSRGGDKNWRDRLRIITFVFPSFPPYSLRILILRL